MFNKDSSQWTVKIDIFSIGILVYFLISGGKYPFIENESLSSYRKSTQEDLVSIVSSGVYKELFNDKLKDFSLNCLQYDPRKRMTAA